MAAQYSGVDQTQAELSTSVIKKIHTYRDRITDSTTLIMRQHLFDNMGELGSVRAIPVATRQFVELLYLRVDAQADEQKWTEQLYDLVRRGLGQKTAVALIDMLYDELQDHVGRKVVPFLRRYRQDFFNRYVEARQRIIVADHESIHKSLQETLTKQVQQERQLRKKLEEEREFALKRAVELETVAQVSANTTAILDQEKLLQGVVDLTTQQFELYHTHIYLLDVTSDTLVMAAGAGGAGRQMKAKNHQIPMAKEHSLVVSAARTHQGVIVNDVQHSPNFLPNPLLPATRSELAVPLIIGKQVLGVLDVQANRVDRFTDEDVKVFTTLAAQVAIALQNARRYDESQRALDELTRLQRIMAREGWEEYLGTRERPLLGFRFDGQEIRPIMDAIDEVVVVPKATGDAAEAESETADVDSLLSLPLAVRGETIGQLGLRNPDGSPIPERKRILLHSIAQQVSEALERARLSEQTQQALAETSEQARRRALLNEVSGQLNRANTLEDVYQIIAEGTAQILPSDRVTLSILNEAGDQYTITSLVGEAGAVPVGKWQSLAGTVSEKAIQMGTVLMMHDPEPRNGVASSLVAPLFASAGAIGTLNVSSKAINVYGKADRDVILQITAILSSVIQSKRLLADAQRRAKREALINAISQKIQSAPTVESAMKTAVTELGQALKLKQALVELTTKQENGHSN